MIRIALPALIALGAALPCFAQYPDRPLTMVAVFPPAAWSTSFHASSLKG